MYASAQQRKVRPTTNFKLKLVPDPESQTGRRDAATVNADFTHYLLARFYLLQYLTYLFYTSAIFKIKNLVWDYFGFKNLGSSVFKFKNLVYGTFNRFLSLEMLLTSILNFIFAGNICTC